MTPTQTDTLQWAREAVATYLGRAQAELAQAETLVQGEVVMRLLARDILEVSDGVASAVRRAEDRRTRERRREREAAARKAM